MKSRTILVSKYSKPLPTKQTKDFHLNRNQKYRPEDFKNYNDWFYFVHIDPYVRIVHALGMFLGLFFFTITFYKVCIFGISLSSIILFFIGTFFFYFLPLLSHHFYDGATAISSPGEFHSTIITVIHINLLTVTGTYDRWLRKFIQKYPFTKEAWELEEKNVYS
jgi:hypothetical protein